MPELTTEHLHPSGTFSFRTPEDWKVTPVKGRAGGVDASGADLQVRFLWSRGENGFDTAHVLCMDERLAPVMEAAPQVEYEHDFISGNFGDRRFLDSAFVVKYDAPVRGQRQWHQQNVTIVGGGETLCVISYAPLKTWKRSKLLFEKILGSLAFPKPAEPAP